MLNRLAGMYAALWSDQRASGCIFRRRKYNLLSRKRLSHFRTLDYSKTKNRKRPDSPFIHKVILYDDKMKVLFNLKGGHRMNCSYICFSPIIPTDTATTARTPKKCPRPSNADCERRTDTEHLCPFNAQRG